MRADVKKYSVAQRIVTTAAVVLLIACYKVQRLALFIPAIGVGVLAVLLWLFRRVYEGNLYKKAMQAAEQGRHLEAIGLLVMAEEAWALNQAHSTPKTITRDFRRLATIVSALQSQARTLGEELDTQEIEKAIAGYVNVYSNRKNFVFGTHNLKASPKAEVKRIEAVFPALRNQFQETCREFYKARASPGMPGVSF
jgi:hypothetical protein